MSHRNDPALIKLLEQSDDDASDSFIASLMKDVDAVIKEVPQPISTDNKPIELKRLETLPDGIEIWIVDGTEIRKTLDNNFLLGDNWLAPPHIVPKNHIWVEKILDPLEMIFIIIHELIEVSLMQHYKFSYPHAHKIASAIELFYRKKLS